MIKAATILLLYFSSLFIGLSHDMPIAMFKLFEENGHTAMHVTLDKENIHTAITTSAEDLDLEDLNDYLKSHIAIALDHRTINFHISAYEVKGDHIHISGTIHQSITDYQNLSVRNTCLLEVANQSNIVQLKYDGMVRDFRMTKERQEIKVEL